MEEKAKLFFRLPDDAPYPIESVWVQRKNQNTAIVLNTPFYVKGVSYLDEVDFVEEDNAIYFSKIIKKNGHSTYRIIQNTEAQKDSFDIKWKALADLGCTFESNLGKTLSLYAIDVPPTADISRVYALLDKGEKEGVWFFEEGDSCGLRGSLVK